MDSLTAGPLLICQHQQASQPGGTDGTETTGVGGGEETDEEECTCDQEEETCVEL